MEAEEFGATTERSQFRSSPTPTGRASSMDRQTFRKSGEAIQSGNKTVIKQVSEEKAHRGLQRKSSTASTASNASARSKTPLSANRTNQNSGNSMPRARSAPPRELPALHHGLTRLGPGHWKGSVNSTVTSRVREREAEFSKQLVERDEQISRLKERLKHLSRKLAETKSGEASLAVSSASMSGADSGAELQSILRQVTKERLQLERHLQMANDSLQRNNGVDLGKYLMLEQTNAHLKQQLDSLDLLQQEHRLVEIQYREKEEACRELMSTLKYKSALCQDLESQLARVIEKNTELTIANSDLQKKVMELRDVGDECRSLRSTLGKLETERLTAETEARSLSGKVRDLESVLAEMQRAAESRREIDRQHKAALESLRRKQEEIEASATKKQEETVRQLQVRIEHLEAEKRLQNRHHQELILEMAELKKYGGSLIGSNVEEDSSSSNSSSLLILDNKKGPLKATSPDLEIDEIMAKLEQDSKFLADLDRQRRQQQQQQQQQQKQQQQDAPASLHRNSTSNKIGNSNNGSNDGSGSSSSGSGSPSNRSPTSSTTLQRVFSAIADSGFTSQSSLNAGSTQHSPKAGGASAGGGALGGSSSSANLKRLPGLTSADKINLLTTGSKGYNAGGIGAANRAAAGAGGGLDGMVEMPGKGWCFVYVAQYSYDPFQHSPNESPEAELQVNAGDYILVWGDADEDGFFDGELLDGRRGLVPSNFVIRLEGHDELADFHEQVILGLQDGVDDSGAESLCTSIPQEMGDIVSSDEGVDAPGLFVVKAHPDDDDERDGGAAAGRLMKSKGAPPTSSRSTIISLPQYASCTDLELTEDDEDEDEEHDEGAMEASNGPKVTPATRPGRPGRRCKKFPPAPKHLTLETQHNRSVVVGWKPPPVPSPQQPLLAHHQAFPVGLHHQIQSFQVVVDGAVHSNVPAAANSSSMPFSGNDSNAGPSKGAPPEVGNLSCTVVGLDMSMIHRISVRSVALVAKADEESPVVRKSHEPACTMVVGKEAPLGPTSVRATRITATAVTVSWIPSNSNFMHSILVNGRDIKTIRPGVFRHTLTGLTPNTLYHVTVRAKNIKASAVTSSADLIQFGQNLASSLEVRTKPQGLPEAPMDVQVERAGTTTTAEHGNSALITVSWLPVTINPMGGTSNGAPVTGYAIYSNTGHVLKEVESGTADQAVVDLSKVDGKVEYITVRTKSSKGTMSNHSRKVPVPTADYVGGTLRNDEGNGYNNHHDNPNDAEDEQDDDDDDDDEDEAGHDVDDDDDDEDDDNGILSRLRRERLEEAQRRHQQVQQQHQQKQSQELQQQQQQQQQELLLLQQHQQRIHLMQQQQQQQMQPRELVINYGSGGYQDGLDSDVGPSELSDIAEEPEEGFTDEEYEDDNGNVDNAISSSSSSGASNRSTPRVTVVVSGRQQQQEQQQQQQQKQQQQTGSLNLAEAKSSGSLDLDGGESTLPDDDPTLDQQQRRPGRSSPSTRSTTSIVPAAPTALLPSTTSTLPTTVNKSTASINVTASNHNNINRMNIVIESAQNPSSGSRGPAKSTSTVHITQQHGLNEDDDDDKVREKPSDAFGPRVGARTIRIFVALFDYDPPLMSPNPDACEEELPFREGQLIKVYGDKDPDGFYWGEANSRSGYVPCNMVSEVQVEDDNVAEELFREQQQQQQNTSSSCQGHQDQGNYRSGQKPTSSTTSLTSGVVRNAATAAFLQSSGHDDRWGDIYEDMPARRKLALYDYDPIELSPNVDAEVELSFRTGDVILVYGDMDDDGFYVGELNGRRGLVPSNFLTDVPTGYMVGGGGHLYPHQHGSSNNRVVVATAPATTAARPSSLHQGHSVVVDHQASSAKYLQTRSGDHHYQYHPSGVNPSNHQPRTLGQQRYSDGRW